MVTDTSLHIRAIANKWVMDHFRAHRKYLHHCQPSYDKVRSLWQVEIITKGINGHVVSLGEIKIDRFGKIIYADDPDKISGQMDQILLESKKKEDFVSCIQGKEYQFLYTDGIKYAQSLPDFSVNLLLTDPPYGISKPYICENQIPRRLRPNGRDFIMPKGNFGDWDKEIRPDEWLHIMLPKVSGWFVSFCAHSQIGEFQNVLQEHKFVAIGAMVWQKTNPVPFNARNKPVNAWEAIVVGKRAGVKFNGEGVVHNVFKHKSPSPQKRIHTTQKPLDLIKQFIELFSQKGELVFDPFAGSGSTVIAAVQSGRTGIGCEVDKGIYHAACERIGNLINEY